MAESGKDAIAALESTTEKNEHNLVIEFGTDRILHYAGVYLVAFLASLAKIVQLASGNITCYPAGDKQASSDFIKYANSYCWESSASITNASNVSCGGLPNTAIFIAEPDRLKAIFRALPYLMIFEALLYALPSIYWHSLVGAKLMGHLKFMKNLLTDIYEIVQKIPRGIYKSDSSYDSDSYYLNGWNGFKPDYRTRQRSRTASSSNEEGRNLLENDGQPKATKEKNFYERLLGDMKDRHLFSMLCFENFSSMEHHPYILSVYHLSRAPTTSPDEAFIGSKIKGMLRLVTNKNNFGGRFLVKAYFCRHIIGVIVSLIAVLTLFWILAWIGADGWQAESFRCDVVHHEDICMICTFLRKFDMLGYIIINLCISLMYLVISLSRLYFIRGSSERAICHYFEEISDTGSAALNKVE